MDKIYTRGRNKAGQRAYRGILLFKMLLISIGYNLSDEQTQDMILDSLSAMDFCSLKLEDDVPDHSTLSRFRSELAAKKAFDRILRKLNAQLKDKGIMVHSGKAKVDASITQSPHSPKGRKTYQVAEDRFEQDRTQAQQDKETSQMKLIELAQPGVDTQDRWLKKSGKLHYGYKRHRAVDEAGMIEGVYTTAANSHESKGLIWLLKELLQAKKEEVWTDKGYKIPANDEALASQGIKNRIQEKGYRNRALTAWQKRRNKLISKQRYKVERTFAGLKKWFGGGICRYIVMEKAHAQHRLEAIAYNLKRSPGLVWSKGVL